MINAMTFKLTKNTLLKLQCNLVYAVVTEVTFDVKMQSLKRSHIQNVMFLIFVSIELFLKVNILKRYIIRIKITRMMERDL